MSSIQENMETAMSKIKDMIDVNTIIGNPITTPDGTTLIPVSKVAFGFGSGGTDGTNMRFGAGVGAGVSVTPVAFMVVKDGNVRMIYVESPANATADNILDMIPEAFDKISTMIKNKKEEKIRKEESVY